MTLRSRVTALERNAGVVGPCRLCDGRGSNEHFVIQVGDSQPKPKGCLGCGRVGHVKVVTLDGTREEDCQ